MQECCKLASHGLESLGLESNIENHRIESQSLESFKPVSDSAHFATDQAHSCFCSLK